ncbi:Protein FAM160B1 [Geodia barretti]|nr:Protein FAM160B1 [Geodia barretti]
MFSRFTALVAEVVGFGPQQIRPEDFTTHWRAITDSIATSDAGGSVSETDIPHHLGAMAELLCEEDSQKDSRDHGTMGLCLEFMLRHRILDTLYIPCKNDYPSGIRQEVLMFLIHMLGRMEQPLLPHVSVHQPVQKLIQLCGLHPQSPLALMEIQFLRTICLKVHDDTRLADFLLVDLPVKRSPLSPPSPSVSSVSPNNASQSSTSSPPVPTKTVYLVAEALQRLVNHNDSMVAMKAYECLLSCVSLRHEGVARVLASSQLPVLLASKLQYHFQLIPLSCSHTSIVGCNTGWG